MSGKIERYVEGIQNEAHDNHTILLPAAKNLVDGLRSKGFTMKRIFAYLLICAIDAHLEQADSTEHFEDIADALEALARSIQEGVDAIREVERVTAEPYYDTGILAA